MLALLFRKVLQNTQGAQVHIFLKQEFIVLPARKAHATGRDVNEEYGLAGKIKLPFENVIIETKELVINFFGHMDHFHSKARAHVDLV